MIRFILIGLVIYILYKLLFELILPIYKTTSQVRSQLRKMQQQEHTAGTGRQDDYSRARSGNAKPSPMGDYIDFEEVK